MPFTNNGTYQNTSRLLSGFWNDCPIDAIRNGSVDGVYVFDDFAIGGSAGSAFSVATNGLYQAYTSSGGAIAAVAGPGGALAFSSDGDNEGAAIVSSTPSLLISTAAKTAWFEARIKTSTIADTKHGFFCGLIETITASVTVPIAAAGTLADQNFIGFHRLEGDGDMIDCVHKADGQTQATDLADAITLVADTYVKVGIKWHAGDSNLYFYKNGVVVKTLAGSAVGSAASVVTFPSDAYLGLCFAVLNATGTTPGNSSLDWWAMSQLY